MDGRRADLFFQLVAARNARGSLLITSNVPFDGWGKLFGDEVWLQRSWIGFFTRATSSPSTGPATASKTNWLRVADQCWRSHSMTAEPSREPSHTAISTSAGLVCGAVMTSPAATILHTSLPTTSLSTPPSAVVPGPDAPSCRIETTAATPPTHRLRVRYLRDSLRRTSALYRVQHLRTPYRSRGHCPECDAVLVLTDLLGEEVSPPPFRDRPQT